MSLRNCTASIWFWNSGKFGGNEGAEKDIGTLKSMHLYDAVARLQNSSKEDQRSEKDTILATVSQYVVSAKNVYLPRRLELSEGLPDVKYSHISNHRSIKSASPVGMNHPAVINTFPTHARRILAADPMAPSRAARMRTMHTFPFHLPDQR